MKKILPPLAALVFGLSGCMGISVSGLGLLMCPDGAICDLTIDSRLLAPSAAPPGLPPGLPLPLPLPRVSDQFAG